MSQLAIHDEPAALFAPSTGAVAARVRPSVTEAARDAQRMPQLDALRTLAVFGVIIAHATKFPGHMVGAYGVTLFFVLSGFLITGILLQCRDQALRDGVGRAWMLCQFYCRRFLRIFPLYYFLLTVLWLAHYEPVRGGAVWFFSYLTDFYFGHAGVWNSAVGHLWSLAVEEQFYLLWPFLVLWTPPRLLPWVAGAMIAFSPTYRGVASALGMSEGALWVSPFSCLDALGLGSLLAIGARLGWGDRLPRLALPAGIAAVMLLVLCRYKFPAGVQPLWSLGPALLSVWLVGSAAKGFGGGIGKVASWRPVLWIGTISYGVYVYHLPVLMLWHRSGLQAPQMIVALIVTAATVGVAAVSWYAFEKPINNLKRLFPYSPARERSRARSTGGDDVEIEKLDQQSWTQSAARFADYNFRQSWHYGIAAAARRGARCEHVAVRYRGDVISLTDVRVKRAPIVGGGVAYVSGGPLVRSAAMDEQRAMELGLSALRDEYVRRQGLILRIAPPLDAGDQVFQSLSFSVTDKAKQYRTLRLDLTRPLEHLRKSLAQKWRNCLNSAERNGLKLRRESTTALLEEFCELFARFQGRKGFEVDIDPQFYLRLQQQSPDAEKLMVTLCDLDGRGVAGHVASMLGDTSVYLFGATDPVGLKARASYLLQWDAIQTAKALGCRWYDLGGIDPEANPTVYHFKSGMGGADVCAPGPFEMAPGGLRTQLLLRGEAALRRIHDGRILQFVQRRPLRVEAQ